MSYARVKRAHRKSRLGCLTCKQRRVKCDETKPQCINCGSRQIACVYANDARAAAPGPDPSSSSPRASHGETSRSSENDTWLNQQPRGFPKLLNRSPLRRSGSSTPSPRPAVHDTEITRHYLEVTAHTLSESSARVEQHWIWHVFVPSLAYTCPTIREGMLTLGAMSLHFSASTRDPLQPRHSGYLTTATTHGEAFVARSRSQLIRLDPGDVDSNTASARLLCVLAFAFLRQYRRYGIDTQEERAWRWLHLLRGVRIVHTSLLKLDQEVNSNIKQDMMPDLFPCTRACSAGPIRSSKGKVMLAYIQQTHAQGFEMLYAALYDGTLNFAEDANPGALAAIRCLERITEHVCRWDEMSSLFRAVCEWPGNLAEDFVRQLTQCHVPALIIYAHWLMLVTLAEDLWWVGDMGAAGIRAVAKLVAGTDGTLLELLQQPLQLLALEDAGQ